MIPSSSKTLSQHDAAAEVAGVCGAEHTLLVELDCDAVAQSVTDWAAWLTQDELAAIGRLPDATARRRAVLRRAGLRSLLGAGLRLPPQRVPLWHEASGRPHVGVPTQSDLLGVSCSSCAGLAVFCLSAGAEVGVDVEAWSGRRFPSELAPHMLHQDERGTFEALPPPVKSRWLAGAWVCKEAWLKARGTGLSVDPCELHLRCDADAGFLASGCFYARSPCERRGFLRWEGSVVMALVLATDAPPLKRVCLRLDAA